MLTNVLKYLLMVFRARLRRPAQSNRETSATFLFAALLEDADVETLNMKSDTLGLSTLGLRRNMAVQVGS